MVFAAVIRTGPDIGWRYSVLGVDSRQISDDDDGSPSDDVVVTFQEAGNLIEVWIENRGLRLAQQSKYLQATIFGLGLVGLEAI